MSAITKLKENSTVQESPSAAPVSQAGQEAGLSSGRSGEGAEDALAHLKAEEKDRTDLPELP